MIAPVTKPTMYFIGVTTRKSSIMQIFPRWMEILKIDAQLLGYDAPLHAPPHSYEAIVQHIKNNPLVKGALVTTHKLDLMKATRHLFDELDTFAQLLHEVSSLSKRDGKLIGHAKDPLTSGLAMQAFIEPDYWQKTKGEVLCFGAGGAAVAISLYLASSDDKPERFTVVDISQERLEHIQMLHQKIKPEMRLETILNADATYNDRLLEKLPEGSLVINATGMGKDRPGSPITGNAVFPHHSLVWELNYRGDLDFLKRAKQQEATAHLHVEDGWIYFLHGWTQVVAEIFDFELTPELFAQLDQAAAASR
jgi:shikimate dehydrogenase